MHKAPKLSNVIRTGDSRARPSNYDTGNRNK